jgi:hypothetical protein
MSAIEAGGASRSKIGSNELPSLRRSARLVTARPTMGQL